MLWHFLTLPLHHMTGRLLLAHQDGPAGQHAHRPVPQELPAAGQELQVGRDLRRDAENGGGPGHLLRHVLGRQQGRPVPHRVGERAHQRRGDGVRDGDRAGRAGGGRFLKKQEEGSDQRAAPFSQRAREKWKGNGCPTRIVCFFIHRAALRRSA